MKFKKVKISLMGQDVKPGQAIKVKPEQAKSIRKKISTERQKLKKNKTDN